jgi:hypothetical protein
MDAVFAMVEVIGNIPSDGSWIARP